MKKKTIAKGFYFITDSTLSKRGNIQDVKSALKARVSAVQYRNKSHDIERMLQEAKALRALCTTVPFIVNDFLDIALKVHADGLHIGKTDISYLQAREALGPEKIIGLSVHSLEEALYAQSIGADYVGVGPIFSTSTKKDAQTPCGTFLIRQIKSSCTLPLVAIGGIHLENVLEVIAAGADCVCAISATVTRPDVKKEIDKYSKLFKM
jgi:thiamine-phosphate pyrophosphorylase